MDELNFIFILKSITGKVVQYHEVIQKTEIISLVLEITNKTSDLCNGITNKTVVELKWPSYKSPCVQFLPDLTRKCRYFTFYFEFSRMKIYVFKKQKGHPTPPLNPTVTWLMSKSYEIVRIRLYEFIWISL